MLILHGENNIQSRNRLFEYITSAKESSKHVHHLDARTLDMVTLEQAVGSESLFGEQKLLVIEELHSLPKSKKKDELIEFINQSTSHSDSNGIEVILWEKRDLTPTMLKKFTFAKSEQFKLSSALFVWLDNLSGIKDSSQLKKMLDLFHKAWQSDGDFMCFSMLTRQLRLLIQAKEGNFSSLAPFMIGKLKKQSTSFSIEQLLATHHKLLLIDTAQKTSQSKLPLAQELELLLLNM